MGASADDALRDELIEQIAAMLDVLVSQAERECAGRTGAEAEWLDCLLGELRPLAVQARDLVHTRRIRDTVLLHGRGPWPEEDLAAIASVDPATLRRILDTLTAAGLAWPDPGETGPERR